MVITFESFRSDAVQSIVADDIISISMGNTYDFTQLQDKIVICPELDDEGSGTIGGPDDPEVCDTINAVDEI
jgi:hypothetical protein